VKWWQWKWYLQNKAQGDQLFCTKAINLNLNLRTTISCPTALVTQVCSSSVTTDHKNNPWKASLKCSGSNHKWCWHMFECKKKKRGHLLSGMYTSEIFQIILCQKHWKSIPCTESDENILCSNICLHKETVLA
jgi:hypothetical protein